MDSIYRDYFCPRCGQKLKKTAVPVNYNYVTGKLRYKVIVQCPARRLWRPLHAKWALAGRCGMLILDEARLWPGAIAPEEKR